MLLNVLELGFFRIQIGFTVIVLLLDLTKLTRVNRLLTGRLARFIPKRAPKAAVEEEDPMKILKLRLAKGEITKKQYAELKKVYEES